ncbi:sodium-independent anion transporter [Salipaludibacillus neizhouensis]|uniref:Sodium-independent anion transporter n=1 Tax=Salipaludibacillus neizhouensis TaxID=885475 RepID=A0A3A9KJU1_9BACI|nr:solute carrier family 26 protein [Salipaludibacillus neizhouensis]RKL68035.1 sodium-independent anion transporter [Salipaludibacillus neizhouensis]
MSFKKRRPLNLQENYDRQAFMRDLVAGLTIFVMLVPQGMAYAMLAGLPPVMGLYASTIPLFIYALFASSRHLAVGPAAIASLLVLSSVSAYAEPGSSEYISLVLILTFMVGAVELLLGLIKAGFLVKFISHPVMNGYTSAAAIVIGVSQLNHLLGVETKNFMQIQFLIIELIENISRTHLITVAIGLGSVITLVVLKKINPKIPAALIVLVLSIITVNTFQLDQRGVTIVGDVPSGFPALTIPNLTPENMFTLFLMVITIALIGFMESLAISQAIADKEKYKVDPNKELRALGLSNIAGSFFSAYPVTGSFSRSAVNHQSGAVSQLSSIITAVSVLLTLLLFTSYFYYLPTAALAAIIFVAIVGLVDIKTAKYLFKVKPLDGWVWVVTFSITLLIGIKWGILVGVAFSLFLLLKRSSAPKVVELGYVEEDHEFRNLNRITEAKRLKDTLMVRIDSSLYFANIAHCEKIIRDLLQNTSDTKWMVIDMSGVNDIDTISIKVLEEIMEEYQEKGVSFLYANLKGQVRDSLTNADWDRKYKEKTSYITMDHLLEDNDIGGKRNTAQTDITQDNDDYMI